MDKVGLKNVVWSWKELVLLLIITFLAVPILIEYGFQQLMFQFFQNDLYSGTLTGLVMAIIFIISVYVIALKSNQLSWSEVGLRPFPCRYWLYVLFWTFILIVLSIAILLIMDFFGIGYENSKTESIQTQVTPVNFIIAFVSASIVSPVYEEIFYRGFLYKWFRRWGVIAAMFLSSTIFMVVHIPTYNVLPVAFVTGLICSWTYEKTGSIIPGIFIHGLFNAIAVILTALA